MPGAFDVRVRHRQPEIMDQPGLDLQQHIQALRGLERINRLSRSSAILWKPISRLAQELSGQTINVLDLATGAGDIPIALFRRAQRAGIGLNLAACDRSEQALGHARARADQAGANVHFFTWDALSGPTEKRYDVVCCSLFLHHLDWDEAVQVLKNMAASARHMVLVNDLRRCSAGWLLAWAGTRLLSRSHVAHVDGPLSVEGAFTIPEVNELAKTAGLAGATVERRWPCRWLLKWRQPGDQRRAT